MLTAARTVALYRYHLKRLQAVGCVPAAVIVELPQRELGCVSPSWAALLEMVRPFNGHPDMAPWPYGAHM